MKPSLPCPGRRLPGPLLEPSLRAEQNGKCLVVGLLPMASGKGLAQRDDVGRPSREFSTLSGAIVFGWQPKAGTFAEKWIGTSLMEKKPELVREVEKS